MKAFLKNYRQSPRKVRLIADLIRGKSISRAENILKFADKRASTPIAKLLNSATKNALNLGHSKDDLSIGEIRVDKGIVMKRSMPTARGSAHPINKRSSNVSIILKDKVKK